jgi:hypothetical protein
MAVSDLQAHLPTHNKTKKSQHTLFPAGQGDLLIRLVQWQRALTGNRQKKLPDLNAIDEVKRPVSLQIIT